MNTQPLSPRRPYLLRAFYDWLLDNQLTPYLLVNVNMPGIYVPMEYAKDGQIVLNLAPRAVHHLEISNEEIQFHARFSGIPQQVIVPMAAAVAIYARENGVGTQFEPEDAYLSDNHSPSAQSTFTSVTPDNAHKAPRADKNMTRPHSKRTMSVVDNSDTQPKDDDPGPPPPPVRGKRPHLRVVK